MENNNTANSTSQMEGTQEPYTKFDAGDSVILHSLVQSTHMNGRRGIIHHYPTVSTVEIPMDMDPNPTEPRCMVRLLPEATNSRSNSSNSITSSNAGISIKIKNMVLDYPSGQEVKLFGLVGAKHYNGRIATIVSFLRPSRIQMVKKSGKREPRYLVEIPVHDDDYKKDDGDNVDETKNVKQILVSPKNLIHLPGHKPPPVPVLDQRLIFTGSMKSIVKVLNQPVYKLPSQNDVLINHPFAYRAEMRGFYLLSDPDAMPLDENGAPDQAELERRMNEDAVLAKLWGKIMLHSYKSKLDNDDDDDEDDETDGNNHLPPSHQQLQSICPTMGRIHKICFNPKCYKIIPNPTSKQSKMKRCTKCNAVAYCNRECALEAWDYHRKTCRSIQNDNIKFADYITLSSPQREEVLQTQRMVRLCVNRIAGSKNADSYFQSNNKSDKELGTGSNTAKLLYDVMTQLGPEITNEILQMVENTPPPNRQVTVAVGFNSLGADPIYSTEDIQLFANVHDCSVTYQQQKQDKDMNDELGAIFKKVVYNDIVTLEPNGEALPRGGNMMGNIPEDVQDGFFNFMNNLVPGGMGGDGGLGGGGAPGGAAQFFMPGAGGMMPGGMGGDNNGGLGGGGAPGGAAQFFMPGAGGLGGGGLMGAAAGGGAAQFFIPAPPGGMPPPGMMMGNINAAGGGQFFMPGQGGMPAANANVPPPGNGGADGDDDDDDDDIPEMGEEEGADNNGADGDNPNDDANAAAGDVPQPQNVPPALANFVQHVLAEAGVGPLPGVGNAHGNDDNDDDTGDANDNDDDNLPQVEDVADDNPNQPPQPQQGNFHFGGAHVHVAHANANEVPPGAPPLPPAGAFFQVPGMPIGVQVAVAQAGPGDGGEGIAGMPPEMAGMMPVGGWMGPGFPQGGEGMENENEDIVEGEMEIED